MTVPFHQIPSALRVPLFYAELDASQANTATEVQRTLLIGQITAAGQATPNIPVLCSSADGARLLAGDGSILAQMAEAYRANDPAGEMWLLPLQDDPTAVAQVQGLTYSGAITSAGTISLYIGGTPIPIAVTAGSTLAQAAAATAAAINANVKLSITAAVDGANPARVLLTAKNAGAISNPSVQFNARGLGGGEQLPAGLAVAIAVVTAGQVNPVLTTALANLGDMPFDFIANSLNDLTSIAAVSVLLNDVTGRWSWQQQLFGHAYVVVGGSLGSLATFGAALNDQHLTVIGKTGISATNWVMLAAFVGAAAVSLRNDPGLPLQYIQVQGILAPSVANRFSATARNTLLYDGISTFIATSDGGVAIENLITTYQKNVQGLPDNSYLEVETMYLLMAVLRRMRSVVTTKYARVKLAADGTRLLPGSNVVTPAVIRADLIAAYRQMEQEDGWVQLSDAFAANLIVEKDVQNPNRVNVLFPPTLINQLRIFAVLAQFRLN